MKKPVERHEVVQPADRAIRLIPLTFCQNAIVDAADYEWLMERNWYAQWQPHTKSFYAHTWDDGKRTGMARIILGLEGETEADHRNGNTLDNRRENLRPATVVENRRNTKRLRTNLSGYKGVRSTSGKWRAQIYIREQGKQVQLGSFQTAEEAAHAYDEAARKYYGEFARCNFAHGEEREGHDERSPSQVGSKRRPA